jgi:hypothetical protein
MSDPGGCILTAKPAKSVMHIVSRGVLNLEIDHVSHTTLLIDFSATLMKKVIGGIRTLVSLVRIIAVAGEVAGEVVGYHPDMNIASDLLSVLPTQ